MRAFFVVVLAPILHLFASVCKAQGPVCVQALGSEQAVERLDEGVVGRFAGPREVERDTALIGPQIQITRNKLSAMVDPDRRREADVATESFEHLNDVGPAKRHATMSETGPFATCRDVRSMSAIRGEPDSLCS